MARIEVLSGDFVGHARCRFDGASMLLRPKMERRLVRHRPSEIEFFEVRDGLWARCFEEAGAWTRAITGAAAAGVPAAGVNLLVPTFFLGQQALITWANALIGAGAAAAAMKSPRLVRFDVRFSSGRILHARVTERALTMRLPQIYRAMIALPR